ncbi:hypothetical protein OH76DRAFT_1397683 [Lentinus brumalis]|uniref:Uncharacterized protein n=1 Tax=Lentinus brumalis TaxID=2498619 RepID=A0A371DPD3_9APHY|nr:hypothetical protein OH76DRAFT_1397683 [Polyporus brumalis]
MVLRSLGRHLSALQSWLAIRTVREIPQAVVAGLGCTAGLRRQASCLALRRAASVQYRNSIAGFRGAFDCSL